jgi:hypothetical protein
VKQSRRNVDNKAARDAKRANGPYSKFAAKRQRPAPAQEEDQ